MQFTKVTSSNIDALSWSDDTLYIQFLNGRTYSYAGVPQRVFEALCSAESVGKEFNATVKGRYDYALLTTPVLETTEG